MTLLKGQGQAEGETKHSVGVELAGTLSRPWGTYCKFVRGLMECVLKGTMGGARCFGIA